jgi:hypothetical protein
MSMDIKFEFEQVQLAPTFSHAATPCITPNRAVCKVAPKTNRAAYPTSFFFSLFFRSENTMLGMTSVNGTRVANTPSHKNALRIFLLQIIPELPRNEPVYTSLIFVLSDDDLYALSF